MYESFSCSTSQQHSIACLFHVSHPDGWDMVSHCRIFLKCKANYFTLAMVFLCAQNKTQVSDLTYEALVALWFSLRPPTLFHHASVPPSCWSSNAPTQDLHVCCELCLKCSSVDTSITNSFLFVHAFNRCYRKTIRFLLRCHLPPRTFPWPPSGLVVVTSPPSHLLSSCFSCFIFLVALITTSHFLF